MTRVMSTGPVKMELVWKDQGNEYHLSGFVDNVVMEEERPNSYDLLSVYTGNPAVRLEARFTETDGYMYTVVRKDKSGKFSKHYHGVA